MDHISLISLTAIMANLKSYDELFEEIVEAIAEARKTGNPETVTVPCMLLMHKIGSEGMSVNEQLANIKEKGEFLKMADRFQQKN